MLPISFILIVNTPPLNENVPPGRVDINPARVAVPPGVVTPTLPDVPPPTTAVMLVVLTTENEVAAVPPKLTIVAPVKLVPVMVTVVPVHADAGVNEVMVGGGLICLITDTEVAP